MPKNKKKSPGRPKKEFVSKKPKSPVKQGPGRPRKHELPQVSIQQVAPAVSSFVAESVDTSKRKDIIILILFLLSFLLFVCSLYFTITKQDRNTTPSSSNTPEITNIDTGNIKYSNMQPWAQEEPTIAESAGAIAPQENKAIDAQQQTIMDFYKAINGIDMKSIYTLTDARLEESSVFKTYFSRNRLTKFSSVIVDPKVTVSDIQEKTTATSNPDIKEYTYTVDYVLAKNQQRYTEARTMVIIKKGDNRRIGKIVCETKGCSTMPFFNPDKYK